MKVDNEKTIEEIQQRLTKIEETLSKIQAQNHSRINWRVVIATLIVSIGTAYILLIIYIYFLQNV
ncbi:hypothetical protein EV213_104120 [Aureibacillus halotolerans]|uniref:Uncharacterized protein n=1 Tax=Aureibacillus halotolerans TaxID=1508390 RepID=A0A4R6U6B1_9BACI|nr:hypothetical protein EV213_104120 [Aureibacillus halotolerans]